MTNVKDLTASQLKQIMSIKEQIEKLQGQIDSIAGRGGQVGKIERVGEPARASTWSYGFWESPSAEEYARRQGVKPVTDIATLYGPGEPQDWQGFDKALERWHAENSVK